LCVLSKEHSLNLHLQRTIVKVRVQRKNFATIKQNYGDITSLLVGSLTGMVLLVDSLKLVSVDSFIEFGVGSSVVPATILLQIKIASEIFTDLNFRKLCQILSWSARFKVELV